MLLLSSADGGFMTIKNMYLTILATFTFACFASKPATKLTKPHEVACTKKSSIETEFAVDYFVSPVENAEQMGSFQCTFNHRKKQGTIDLLEVYKGFRNYSYGAAWFKRAIIALTAFKPKSICWDAQPLDNYFSKEDLSKLMSFYIRHGGIVTKEHINAQDNYVKMEYPMALAHALSILHPIFAQQKQSPILANQKQQDPFTLIAAYANIDLKNKDLKS